MNPLPVGGAKTALVREMFERIAPRYDRMNRVVSLGLDQRWRRAAIAAIGVGPGDLVVDLACGTGDLAELAARAGARVVALDSARAMLRGARARGVGAGLGLSDASLLPLRSACASAVTCGFALRNFTAPDRCCARRRACSRPAAGSRCSRSAFRRARSRAPATGSGSSTWCPSSAGSSPTARRTATCRARSPICPREGELVRALRAAGFERVARTPFLFGAAQLFTAVRA